MNRLCASACRTSPAGTPTHVCVPVQGSGTFAVEATIGTLLPRDGKLLVLINGAYGAAHEAIAGHGPRRATSDRMAEDMPVDRRSARSPLAEDPAISMSPSSIARRPRASSIRSRRSPRSAPRHGRHLLIDAMSAFGALPLDARKTPFDALMASSEQMPGRGARHGLRDRPPRRARGRAKATRTASASISSPSGAASSRTTSGASRRRPMSSPPSTRRSTSMRPKGGVAGRGARYARNCSHPGRRHGGAGLRDCCCRPRCRRRSSSPSACRPIRAFVFDAFYDRLRAAGFVIYPGKLTVAD